jgi:hypothetical protein
MGRSWLSPRMGNNQRKSSRNKKKNLKWKEMDDNDEMSSFEETNHSLKEDPRAINQIGERNGKDEAVQQITNR